MAIIEDIKVLEMSNDQETTTIRIVLVDDDDDLLYLISQLISSIDSRMSCYTFNSPKEALQFIKEDSIIPDLIVSDYNMGKTLNGIEFYQELIKNGYEIPFIILSSFLSENIIKTARQLGISKCISKDADIKKLISVFLSFVDQ